MPLRGCFSGRGFASGTIEDVSGLDADRGRLRSASAAPSSSSELSTVKSSSIKSVRLAWLSCWATDATRAAALVGLLATRANDDGGGDGGGDGGVGLGSDGGDGGDDAWDLTGEGVPVEEGQVAGDELPRARRAAIREADCCFRSLRTARSMGMSGTGDEEPNDAAGEVNLARAHTGRLDERATAAAA